MGGRRAAEGPAPASAPATATRLRRRSRDDPGLSSGWQVPNERSVTISFRNIEYTVKTTLRKESRCILRGVSGELLPGQLTAIMGPSGAGKSTLMDILAGYTTSGVKGNIYVNGRNVLLHDFQDQICYIMQDDKVQPFLSVQESMYIAADLKMGEKVPPKVKQNKIKSILESLGLSDSADTRTNSLSGGQRKRLAIALEMINNPLVMFFDEPTSGLDSRTSQQCVTLLKQLAQQGRTVVCTIHQPSALLFEMFDGLYALAAGHCMYRGPQMQLLPHLDAHHFSCPPYHNPADFLLEVLVGEHGPTNELAASALEGPEPELTPAEAEDSDSSADLPENASELRARAKGMLLPHCCSGSTKPSHFPTSFLTQLLVLLRRTLLIHLRDKFLIRTRVLLHFFIGLLIGVLYYNIGNDAAYFHDNFAFLYFCIMFIQFTAFSSKILSYPLEMPILMREYFNRWYSLKSYFIATIVADIPVQVLCTIGYSLVAYFLTSQPADLRRLALFIIICLLVGLVSQAIGVLIGLSMGIQNGMVFGPLAILPFLIFSGFFVTMKDAPWYFEWLFHTSYLKYALEGIMQAMYSYNRQKLACSAVYCHYRIPHKFLEDIDMKETMYATDVTFLLVLYISLLAITYFVLLYKLRRGRC